MANQYVGGATLSWSAASPISYLAVGLVKDIKKGAKSSTVLDATTQDVTDNTKRKLGGLVDPGQCGFQLWGDLTDSTGHVAMLAAVGSVCYFKLTLKGGSGKIQTFAALIQSVSETYPVDGGQMWDVSLDISGPTVVA